MNWHSVLPLAYPGFPIATTHKWTREQTPARMDEWTLVIVPT